MVAILVGNGTIASFGLSERVSDVPNVTAEQTGVMYIDHHIYEITGGEEDWDEPSEPPNDGLLTGPDRTVRVLTGLDWKNLTVTVRFLDGPAAQPGAGAYEMVSERDLEADARFVEVSPVTDTSSRMAFPRGADRYRVRVSVTGRSAAADGAEDAEHHLVELWPTETSEPPATLVGPDAYARAYKGR